MCHDASTSLIARPLAAGDARAWTSRLLTQCYDEMTELVENAELVVSELVTNAFQAGSDMIEVQIEAHATRSVIRVRDYAAGQPIRVQSPDIGALAGRGLTIVDAVAGAWGTETHEVGKTVWATLSVPSSARPLFVCDHDR